MALLSYHLLIVAVCLIMKIFGVADSSVGLAFTIMSSSAVVAYIIGLKNVDKRIKLIILSGFILRIILVIIDVFVVRLVDAGTDDDGFYASSINIYDNNYAGFTGDVYGGAFPKILSIVYYIIGSSRFSAQYFNVLLYAISSILFLKALTNFKVSQKYLTIGMLIFCLLPNAMLNNSVLRRETAMGLCICASLFYVSKWQKNGHILFATLAVVFLALSSLFHTALILGVPILVIFFTLYDKEKQSVSFSITKVSKMLIILVCVIIASFGFLSMLKNKFTSVSGLEDVYAAANRARGGSVYLEEYEVNSIGQLILFTPLKLFYFWFSPVPWKFRGTMDIISFFLDVTIYIILIFRVLKARKGSFSRLAFVMFIILSIIFALGTNNSGTAIRHRLSLLPFLLISYSIVETKREITKNNAKSEESDKLFDMPKRRLTP